MRLLLKATAPDSAQAALRRLPETEISGLLIDQTLTKIGHDFYALFYAQWDPPPNLGEFTVLIREKPGRPPSTLIALEVNENLLVELPLSPNYEALEEAVAYGLNAATDYLINARTVGQQLEKTADDPGKEVY
ncbi:hypothetical protein J0X19_22390 [Hymenobacter sp. BT186]|uniref:Curli production assembly/transport component CsgE n=1 Tax=Hymenobacter telluris TaxID=2816474 RepID=A0A939F1P5_9BACT|nr:CsgE family curli-type amyloid fiber assembly protein [Hymenobacter telluris]MBO0360727.1 hypothetical protein [Hymenobacter telluris]